MNISIIIINKVKWDKALIPLEQQAKGLVAKGGRITLYGIDCNGTFEQQAKSKRFADLVMVQSEADFKSVRPFVRYLQEQWDEKRYEVTLFENDGWGREACVRLAEIIRGVAILDSTGVRLEENIWVERPIYSGNMTAVWEVKGVPCFVTISQGAPPVTNSNQSRQNQGGEVQNRADVISEVSEFGIRCVRELSRTTDILEEAEVVVIGGAAIKTEKELSLMQKFAEQIGGVLAGTRPLIMNGLLPVERLVGQSGKVITPKLCIVVGASGATPFTFGIKSAKKIVVINNDRHAPIFKIADYGIVGDFKEILPECTKYVTEILKQV